MWVAELLFSVAEDDDVVHGYDVGSVDIIVAINVGALSGEAAGVALLDVAVDGHYVGGVD